MGDPCTNAYPMTKNQVVEQRLTLGYFQSAFFFPLLSLEVNSPRTNYVPVWTLVLVRRSSWKQPPTGGSGKSDENAGLCHNRRR